MISKDKLEKVAAIIHKFNTEYKFIKEPDFPPCPICGRIIYCGVNELCSLKECPKK